MKRIPGRRETILAVGVAAFFLVGALLTAGSFVHITVDEVSYSDPAVNLALNGHFSSSSWYGQAANEFWASNMPLHQLLLFVWLKIWGFSITSVRGLGIALVCAAAILYWNFLRKAGWLDSPIFGFLFLVTFLAGYGMTLSMRLGRPDPLCIFLGSLICQAWLSQWRIPLMFLLGALAMATGVHMAAWLAALGGSLVAFAPRKTWKLVAAGAAGMVVGLFVVGLIYWWHGVLGSFAASVLPHTAFDWLQRPAPDGAQAFQWPRRILWGLPSQDYSVWVLTPFFVLFAWLSMRWGLRDQTRYAAWTIVAVVGTCAVFFLLGVTPPYYSWMIFVPLSAATFSLASAVAHAAPQDRMARALTALALAACIFSSAGLARRVAKVIAHGPLMPQEQLGARIQNLIGERKVLFCDVRAYYAVKKQERTVFTGLYRVRMNEEEKAKCEAAVVDADRLPDWVMERVKIGSLHEAGRVYDMRAPGRSPWLDCLAGDSSTHMQRANFVVFVQTRR